MGSQRTSIRLNQISTFIESSFRGVFSKWGYFVGKNPGTVLLFSLAVLLILSTNLLFFEYYPAKDLNWVPRDGEMFSAYLKMEPTMGYRPSEVPFVLRARSGNLLTLEAFKEIRRID